MRKIILFLGTVVLFFVPSVTTQAETLRGLFVDPTLAQQAAEQWGYGIDEELPQYFTDYNHNLTIDGNSGVTTLDGLENFSRISEVTLDNASDSNIALVLNFLNNNTINFLGLTNSTISNASVFNGYYYYSPVSFNNKNLGDLQTFSFNSSTPTIILPQVEAINGLINIRDDNEKYLLIDYSDYYSEKDSDKRFIKDIDLVEPTRPASDASEADWYQYYNELEDYTNEIEQNSSTNSNIEWTGITATSGTVYYNFYQYGQGSYGGPMFAGRVAVPYFSTETTTTSGTTTEPTTTGTTTEPTTTGSTTTGSTTEPTTTNTKKLVTSTSTKKGKLPSTGEKQGSTVVYIGVIAIVLAVLSIFLIKNKKAKN